MKPKYDISWVWSLLHEKDVIRNKGRWLIGSGANISIIEDVWLAYGEKALINEACTMSNVQDLNDPVSHSWIIPSLRVALDPLSAIDAPE